MAERIVLYTRRPSPGEPLPINITPVLTLDGVPTNSEVQDAASNLSNGHSGGALMMHAEYIKQWLQGIRREEDPKQS